MTYYPKSQVKTNLYTKGGEFQLKSTKQKYSGYYWKNSKGEIFTKKSPNVGGSELLELIPKTSTPSINTITYVEGNNVYNSLKKVNIADSLLLPSYQLLQIFLDYLHVPNRFQKHEPDLQDH